MEICQFFDWNLAMLTFYDYLEEFLSLGVLSEDDKISTSKSQNQNSSPQCITPEPQESQILKFTRNSPDKKSISNSHKSSKQSTNYLDITNLAPTARKHLLRSIFRLSLHISHFIASEYLTSINLQREIAFLVISLARKLLKIKDYSSPLLKDLYKVTINNEDYFNKNLAQLELDFSDIYRYFRVNFNEFDDGLGSDNEAFGPFGPFDLTEREYDKLGNAFEGNEELLKKIERYQNKRQKSEDLGMKRSYQNSSERSNKLMKALVKVEYAEQRFKENKARRHSSGVENQFNITSVNVKVVNSGNISNRSIRDNALRVSTKVSGQNSRSEKGSFNSYQNNDDFMNMSVFSKNSKRAEPQNRKRYNSFTTQPPDDIVPTDGTSYIAQNKAERPDIPKPVVKKQNEIYTQNYYKIDSYLNNKNLIEKNFQRSKSNDISTSKIENEDSVIVQNGKTTGKKKGGNKWKSKPKKLTTTPIGEEVGGEEFKSKMLAAYMSLPLKQQLEGIKINGEENNFRKFLQDETLNNSHRTIESELLRGSRFVPLKGYKSDKYVDISKRNSSEMKDDTVKVENAIENFLKSNGSQGNLPYNLTSSVPKKEVEATKKEDKTWEFRMVKTSESASNKINIVGGQIRSVYSHQREDIVKIESNDKYSLGNGLTSQDIKFSSTKKKIEFQKDAEIKIDQPSKEDKMPSDVLRKLDINEKNEFIIPNIDFSDKKEPIIPQTGKEDYKNPKNSIKNENNDSQLRSAKNSANNPRNPLFAQTRLSRNNRPSNQFTDQNIIAARSNSQNTYRSSSNTVKYITGPKQTISGIPQNRPSKPPGLPVYSHRKITKTESGSVYKKNKEGNTLVTKRPKLVDNLAKSGKKKKGRNPDPKSLRYYPSDDNNKQGSMRSMNRRIKYSGNNNSILNMSGSNYQSIDQGNLYNVGKAKFNFSSVNLFGMEKGSLNSSGHNFSSMNKIHLDDISKNIPDSIKNKNLVSNGAYFTLKNRESTNNLNTSRGEISLIRSPKESIQDAPNIKLDSLFNQKQMNTLEQKTHNYQNPLNLTSSEANILNEKPEGNLMNKYLTQNEANNSNNLRHFLQMSHKIQNPINPPNNGLDSQDAASKLRVSKSIDHRFQIPDNFFQNKKDLTIDTENSIRIKNYSSFNGAEEIKKFNTMRNKIDSSPADSLQNNLRGSYSKMNTFLTQIPMNNTTTLRGSYMNNINSLRVSSNLEGFKAQQNLQIQALKQTNGGLRIEGENNSQQPQIINSSRGNLRRVQIANKIKNYEKTDPNVLRNSNHHLNFHQTNTYSRNHLLKGFYQQDTRNLSKSPGSIKLHINQNNLITMNGANQPEMKQSVKNTYLSQNQINTRNDVLDTSKSQRAPDVDEMYKQLKQKHKYNEALKKAAKSSKMALQHVIENQNTGGNGGVNMDKFWLKKKNYYQNTNNGNATFFKELKSQRVKTEGGVTQYLRDAAFRRSRDGF